MSEDRNPFLPTPKEQALQLAIDVAKHAQHYISPDGVVSMAKVFEQYLREDDNG